MDYFAIATQGFYPTPTPSDEQRMSYASSWGFLSVLFEEIDTGFFTDGQYLIRQPWSEDYLLGDTLILRLPWSEDYRSGDNLFTRSPWSEDYGEYIRQPNSENYENSEFRFTRQPDTEDYLIEAK